MLARSQNNDCHLRVLRADGSERSSLLIEHNLFSSLLGAGLCRPQDFSRSQIKIARSFVIEGLPEDLAGNLENYPTYQVDRRYLAIDRENEASLAVQHIQINGQPDRCQLVFNKGCQSERAEVVFNISAEMFKTMAALNPSGSIRSQDSAIGLRGNSATLHSFQDALDGQRILEVPFKSLAQANSYQPEKWFKAEVTGKFEFTEAGLLASAPQR